MKKKVIGKVKWFNVFVVILFATSCIDLIYVSLKLSFSTISLSHFGVITVLLSIVTAGMTGEYLYEQL